MARSKGYRPKKAVKEEVAELRAHLATLRDSDWVKAGLIMQEIAQPICPHYHGPTTYTTTTKHARIPFGFRACAWSTHNRPYSVTE